MRYLVALSLAAIGLSLGARASLAQVPIYDDLDDILYGRINRPKPLFHPDLVITEQYFEFAEFHADFYVEQFVGQPTINTPDLANPFNSTVGSQAGYYRATQTEPSLEFIEASSPE
ncbi:hypothetical protein [Synechococcus sp. PCC 7336]|uniref:hypothetical protein n=1 Tax=Synechococcus sp. PCC 7336 TaxID=195250 RepID=UPI000368F9A5|nr:hypothetical protein [Synechococcus sp. PCC 7336]